MSATAQLPLLLGPSIPAASTDPVTSWRAAEAITDSGRRDRHIAIVVDAVTRHPGSTSRELGERLPALGRHEVARRLPDARKRGLVRQGEPRMCRVGERRAVTWWPIG